jgi:glutamate-ammonia-ligase adenylyltransferase
LLKANPQLADLLIDIVTTSPMLADHLARNSGVFDAVIGGDFFSDWPGQEALTQMLATSLDGEADYEARLDGTRRWAREWHFRIGVHLLRGLTDAGTAGAQYADLARAVLGALWPVVIDHFATRHGPPPGQGAVILGMGSLGAGRLTATSDLDMLVIYDPDGQDSSEGKRPLATRLYYARLTQAMITAMTAPMSQGKLYEIDMRLRPSGNQGPVATSINSFESYQRDEAWVWEHLALTRAMAIAGPEDLRADVEALRADVLSSKAARANVVQDVVEMRERIADAKASEGIWDAKIGRGRLQDIELFAQTGALIMGQAARDIPAGLQAALAAGLLSTADAESLTQSYNTCWALQCATRLLSATPITAEGLGDAGAAFLCRSLDCATLPDLEAHLTQIYGTAGDIIDRALGGAGAT